VGKPTLQFWFELASTYSYPAAMRVQGLAEAAGVDVEWRPFLLGPIFSQQGWNDSPFNIYPAKGRYMWRDLERLCAEYQLPWRRPSQFPRGSLLAARVAGVAQDEPWVGDFVRAIYRLNFVDDAAIGSPEVVEAALTGLGQPAPEWIARAQTSAGKEHLKRQTQQAIDLGIFGAPSFVVGGELFWGNERLPQALAWARRG